VGVNSKNPVNDKEAATVKLVDDVQDLSITAAGVYIKLVAALIKIENRGIAVEKIPGEIGVDPETWRKASIEIVARFNIEGGRWRHSFVAALTALTGKKAPKMTASLAELERETLVGLLCETDIEAHKANTAVNGWVAIYGLEAVKRTVRVEVGIGGDQIISRIHQSLSSEHPAPMVSSTSAVYGQTPATKIITGR
jgi:hypothetical protein